jgi:hypothetical protein
VYRKGTEVESNQTPNSQPKTATIAAHLKKRLALLELAKSKAEDIRIRWRSTDLGSWESVCPRWHEYGGKIWFQFSGQGSGQDFWITAIKTKSWGIHLYLSSSRSPMIEVFEMAWHEPMPALTMESRSLWDVVKCWLRQQFPGHQVIQVEKKSDLARTLSGLFLRVLFRFRGRECFLLAADENAGDAAHLAVSQALLWIEVLKDKRLYPTIPVIFILVPSEVAAALTHRCQYLNDNRVKIEVWEYSKGCSDDPKIQCAAVPPAPQENRDYRWPVLGPFRWSHPLEKVINLAPELIRRYPRFQDYDSLRLCGLEFARAIGPDRNRIAFGVGTLQAELTENNFDSLQSLVREILYYRRPDSPDTQHPYYRLQAERWLESLILEEVSYLLPEMFPEAVYSQIPVYLGRDPGRIDILGADRQGTLVVMELKVHSDPDLPLQALDYWGRVLQHQRNGDFEHRGYFSEVRLNREYPKIYLISPVFSFHDSTELLLRYLDPNLEVCKISINEDWRCGVKIIRRVQYRCKELT